MNLLKFFEFDHLPDGPLKNMSCKFHDFAHEVARSLPQGAEATVSLRKLLEAKDAAVRAALEVYHGDSQ